MHKNLEAIRILPSPTQSFSFPQLDLIRVVAMLGIFSHHLWKTVIQNPQGPFESALDILFSAASDGVILFNFLSGFLLAMPHMGQEPSTLGGYGAFLKKRFLRIIPPYYLALFFFSVANIVEFGFPLPRALDVLLQHLLFINSLNYSNMYLNFSHFWYLGLLAQFYLAFPLLLRFLLWAGPGKATLWIISLCWGGWLLFTWCFPATGPEPGTAENLLRFNLPGRLPEFAIGMWLASLWSARCGSTPKRILVSPIFFAAAMVLCGIAGALFLFSMNLPLIHIQHVFFSLILFVALLLWAPAARAGRSFFVRNLSGQSYTIYIAHHPLFSYLGVTPSTVAHTTGNFAILTAILLPISYVTAVALNLLSAAIVKRFFRKPNEYS